MIIHLGARTDTTETNVAIFDQLNLHYTQQVWALCTQFGIPLLYASSAATYGNGEHGYTDSHQIVPQLHPLNPSGRSKNDFDAWALQQTQTPPMWYGVKFFNVYGPNEYHKGRMASVIMHGFNQIKQTGGLKLFKSHRPDYANGQQLRDFIYVKDVVSICWHLLQTQPQSGLYNVGTGKANSFLHLAESTFAAMNLTPNIEFIDIPADIRNTYQYFTEANTTKLLSTGYNTPFYSLADGITAYVQMYLTEGKYW
jgi:ADP-L-glycero-D-manno-heptose 6-epimerase